MAAIPYSVSMCCFLCKLTWTICSRRRRLVCGLCSNSVAQASVFEEGCFSIDKLAEVAESDRLTNKMKIAFGKARKEEASFESLFRELCCSLRASLSKKRRLAAELEALIVGDQKDTVKDLEGMKEIVKRDAVTVGVLEQLLARAQVGVGLKDGYLADVSEMP